MVGSLAPPWLIFPSLPPPEVAFFFRKHFFPPCTGWVMKAAALIPVWSPNVRGNFTSRIGEIGIPSSIFFSDSRIKRSFCIRAPNGKARPLGFPFFPAAPQQSASGPKGEAIFSFVSEMRVHHASQETGRRLQTEGEKIDFSSPCHRSECHLRDSQDLIDLWQVHGNHSPLLNSENINEVEGNWQPWEGGSASVVEILPWSALENKSLESALN